MMIGDNHKPRVGMLILNEIVADGRVLRAAEALSKIAEVTVIGINRGKSELDYPQIRSRFPFKMEWVDAKSNRHKRTIISYALRYVSVALKMFRILSKLKPHIIHAHEVDTLPIAMAYCAWNRTAIVYDAHELYRELSQPKGISNRIIAFIETWAMRRCKAIIACNHQRGEVMHHEYGAPFMPTVVQNVPPWQAYHESNRLRKYVAEKNPSIRWICLHQGVINPGRGIETLLDSLEYLQEDVGIVLLGDGDMEYVNKLKCESHKRGYERKIYFHPQVGHYELHELTCSADIGIIIYKNICRNNYLCAPNKMYEYAAAGLPMVGAEMPPIREYFDETGSGILFDPTNGRSLANAIQEIIKSQDKYEQYKNNCLKAAMIYCWEKEQKHLLDMYRQII
jgi:glycosyltransferase involved in cell wall biosynthesis